MKKKTVAPDRMVGLHCLLKRLDGATNTPTGYPTAQEGQK